MAFSIYPEVRGSASVEDLVSYCRSHVNYGDYDSILGASDVLSALANDRELLVRAINSTLLKRDDYFNDNMGVSSQSIILHSDPTFKIRANVWKAPVARAGSMIHDSNLYSYNYAHNHNFELLTVGYLGSGYWTEIHECKPDRIQGYIGETVELEYLEKTSLPQGKVILFRACEDVHTQLPCEELSISLNLLVVPPYERLADQYSFDVAKSQITGVITSPNVGCMSLLTFAALLGTTEAYSSIEKIAFASNRHWRVRNAAVEVASLLAPGEKEALWRRAERDTDPAIRRSARSWLEREQSEAK
ncbi:transposase [Xanthomonas campestris]|uniref:transposase n=1 Tax=Xanthomonas campestris TaxID=339 RepID=UPI000E0EE62B|nr:transposase [Xanthomonas campestris]